MLLLEHSVAPKGKTHEQLSRQSRTRLCREWGVRPCASAVVGPAFSPALSTALQGWRQDHTRQQASTDSGQTAPGSRLRPKHTWNTLGTQGTVAGVTNKWINWEIPSLKNLSLLPVLILDVPVNSSNFFRYIVPRLSPGPTDTLESENQHPHDPASDVFPRATLTAQRVPAGPASAQTWFLFCDELSPSLVCALPAGSGIN